jgi:hypothetical protein
MESERYSMSFLGLDPHYYTTEIIANVWDIGASRIFEETGIYITGEIQERHLVSQKNDGEHIGSLLFLVESKRMPSESEADYWNAYKGVLEEVRYRLGNPRMDLTIEKIDMTHFEKI